eukprot:4526822-Prymnesium_polylepis.1
MLSPPRPVDADRRTASGDASPSVGHCALRLPLPASAPPAKRCSCAAPSASGSADLCRAVRLLACWHTPVLPPRAPPSWTTPGRHSVSTPRSDPDGPLAAGLARAAAAWLRRLSRGRREGRHVQLQAVMAEVGGGLLYRRSKSWTACSCLMMRPPRSRGHSASLQQLADRS